MINLVVNKVNQEIEDKEIANKLPSFSISNCLELTSNMLFLSLSFQDKRKDDIFITSQDETEPVSYSSITQIGDFKQSNYKSQILNVYL